LLCFGQVLNIIIFILMIILIKTLFIEGNTFSGMT